MGNNNTNNNINLKVFHSNNTNLQCKVLRVSQLLLFRVKHQYSNSPCMVSKWLMIRHAYIYSRVLAFFSLSLDGYECAFMVAAQIYHRNKPKHSECWLSAQYLV